MKVQFTQDIAITALGGRFVHGDVVEVPDDMVDFLVSGGYAVVVNDAPVDDSNVVVDDPDAVAPVKTKRARKVDTGDPVDDEAKG